MIHLKLFVNETALFVDENNNSVHKKIHSAISENQNGDCYVMGSWPQHKRRKIVGQLTSSSYASSSLMRKLFQPNVTDHVNGNMNTIEDPDTVQISEGFYMSHMGDDMQPNAIKSSVEDIHQTSGPHMVWPEFSSPKLQVEEIKPGLEARSGSANKCGARSPSGLTKPSTGVSQGSSLEKVPRDNHTIVILDETSEHTAEKNQVSLQLEDRFELGSSELLTCTETATKEKRFHLERNGKSLSNSVSSPHSQSVDLIGTDQNMPVYEWFGMETEGIDFEKLDLSDSALESAFAVERLCKSVCLETPLSHFATAYNKHKTLNLYQSVPNGLLEVMELSTTVNTNTFTNAPSTWDIRKPLMSPVGKLWEGITSRSGSSEKRVSSIPDLPCISEENENTIEVPETFKDVVVYDSEIVSDRYSLASVSTEYSFTGTCRRDKFEAWKTRKAIEENVITSLRKGGLSLAETRSKHNNIVSNITSFIPLVQQKQAAAVVTGKRDVKVKALEAAEVAKRLAEKKENERKIRKEALKLERAKMEEQNLRHKEAAAASARGKSYVLRKKRKKENTELQMKEHSRTRNPRTNQESMLKMGKEKGDTNLQKGDCGDNSKEMTVIFKAAGNDSLKEQAYEISPYKGSDDEDEDDEDDDKENNKFIPSWASKNHLALIAYSQQSIDPQTIFAPESFPDKSEGPSATTSNPCPVKGFDEDSIRNSRVQAEG
ncbi:TROPONIN I [Salix purpurea]|uniref:TROPONIN I n=1 Tax=Salix purpurea TaxID=77065 RepID=A0A9Q1A137_SALPP|nr:TROPONIN I [Salix purpurea]